jgi:hypothetical protein
MLLVSSIVGFVIYKYFSIGPSSPVGLFAAIYVLLFASLNVFMSVFALIVVLVSRFRPLPLAIIAHFQLAIALGPLFLPFLFLFREKLRYCARLALGIWFVCFGTAFGTGFIIYPVRKQKHHCFILSHSKG